MSFFYTKIQITGNEQVLIKLAPNFGKIEVENLLRHCALKFGQKMSYFNLSWMMELGGRTSKIQVSSWELLTEI